MYLRFLGAGGRKSLSYKIGLLKWKTSELKVLGKTDEIFRHKFAFNFVLEKVSWVPFPVGARATRTRPLPEANFDLSPRS